MMFSQDETEVIDEESVFNILIATDIHLGYNEKHPTRGRMLDLFRVRIVSCKCLLSCVHRR